MRMHSETSMTREWIMREGRQRPDFEHSLYLLLFITCGGGW
jgi:hypothetical protein